MSGEPFPKSAQLARGERKYRRAVASPKRWQAIIEAKRGPCRACSSPVTVGSRFGRIEYHHLVPRSQGGDDTADNIVPLHRLCHDAVTRRRSDSLTALAASLTEPERAYVTGKLGDGALERLFGAATITDAR